MTAVPRFDRLAHLLALLMRQPVPEDDAEAA